MSNRKLIYTILFSVLALGCLWAFVASFIITHNFKKEVFANTSAAQKINIKNLVMVETKDEMKHWELFAEKGHYDSSTKNAILYDIVGNFYNENEVVVSFKSKQASANEDTKLINLNKESVIIYKDGTYVVADEFTWEGKTDNITAKGNVQITRPNQAKVIGEYAELSNKLTDFKISGRTKTELYGDKEGKI